MPRVMVKGFGEVDLPDGMSQEQMRLALRQMYPTSARQSATDALTPIQAADTYEPTLSEMISSGIGETLYDTGIVSDRYRAMDTGRTLGTATEMLPVVGDMIGGDDFGRAIAQDDMVGTGIGALSTIPVVGKPLGKGIKYAKGKLDFDPLDPNSQDLSQTKLFHGTSDVIDKPDINKTQAQDAGFMGQGFYMTGQPPVAQHYAEKSARATGGNPNIHPMTTKADASLVISPEEAAELKRFIASNPDSSSIVSEKLKQGGYDSIAIKSGDDVIEMNVFDPNMVESKFSASLFDELGDDTPSSLFDQIDTSYRGQHTAPYRDDEDYHSSLDDVTNMFGDDIYTGNAVRYFGVGSDYDQEAVDIIQQMAGDPDGMVTIYRAVPEGVDDINPRDWVTTTKQYALDHIGGDEGYKVISKEVKAKDVFTDGNSIHEFGYDPTDK